MSLAKRYPLFGILAGIALLVVGFNSNQKALWIVGLVLIVFGLLRGLKR